MFAVVVARVHATDDDDNDDCYSFLFFLLSVYTHEDTMDDRRETTKLCCQHLLLLLLLRDFAFSIVFYPYSLGFINLFNVLCNYSPKNSFLVLGFVADTLLCSCLSHTLLLRICKLYSTFDKWQMKNKKKSTVQNCEFLLYRSRSYFTQAHTQGICFCIFQFVCACVHN